MLSTKIRGQKLEQLLADQAVTSNLSTDLRGHTSCPHICVHMCLTVSGSWDELGTETQVLAADAVVFCGCRLGQAGTSAGGGSAAPAGL